MAKNVQIPKAVDTKIYKTGQTRGADDDVIFQNRVSRNSTVLIPYKDYSLCKKAPSNYGKYENGFIVLIKPEEYFDESIKSLLEKEKLTLGKNLLVFYETRAQWKNYPILQGWKPASSRQQPLKGQYVARIPATTSEGESKIIEGFTDYKVNENGEVYSIKRNKILKQYEKKNYLGVYLYQDNKICALYCF